MNIFCRFTTPEGKEITKPIKLSQVFPHSRIVLSTFFPEFFKFKTVYTVLDQEIEKDKVTYILKREFV